MRMDGRTAEPLGKALSVFPLVVVKDTIWSWLEPALEASVGGTGRDGS